MSNAVSIHNIRKGNELRDWLEMAPKGYRKRLADLSGVSNNYLTHIAHGYRINIGIKHVHAIVQASLILNVEIQTFYGAVMPELTYEGFAAIERKTPVALKNSSAPGSE